MTVVTNMSSEFDTLFSPEAFRQLGHALIDVLTQYLEASLQQQRPVIAWRAPSEALPDWQLAVPETGDLNPQQWLKKLQDEILPACLAIHHPHNVGHQVAPPLPIAALCDLVAALTNQAMAVYETGPSATLLEKQVIRWLCDLVGWQSGDGVLTSGGAQANLTALLAARQHCDARLWEKGIQTPGRLCLLSSAHAHYSVARAAGIMGIGTQQVLPVACDAAGRMRVDALAAAYAECQQAQMQVIAVVATAGCTPTGSIDPLSDIAAFCQEYGLWLHVDGAHGASALLSTSLRDLLVGISGADSVVWDGHKLLYMPAAVSAVLFRQRAHSYAAFHQEASYLFQGENLEAEAFNTSYRTLECTKRMMALKLWTAFSLYGRVALGAMVERVFETARQFATLLEARPAFELLMPPQTNIVCFRHRPEGVSGLALNQHQQAVRQQVIESGQFHLTQVTLTLPSAHEPQVWLRTAIMHPLTTVEDLQALLTAIERLARLA